jgi:predicted enzyme related to lactoylglutathione lyase
MGAVFVDFFHFLLLFVTFFIACNFYKLLFTVETGVRFVTYTYDLATTPAGTGAGGCLTAKKGA